MLPPPVCDQCSADQWVPALNKYLHFHTRENIEFQQNNVATQIPVGLACKLPLTSRDPNIK